MLIKPKNEITPTSILIKGCAYLDLLDPDPEHISLAAVAAGLEEPRWCNQTTRTITVADHLLRCARIAVACGGSLAEVSACLLHDAAEAFLRDIPGPLKPHVHVVVDGVSLSYAEVERELLRSICTALIADDMLRHEVLGLLDERNGVVKKIDGHALRIEALRWLPGSVDWALDETWKNGDPAGWQWSRSDPRAWMVADTPGGSMSWIGVAQLLGRDLADLACTDSEKLGLRPRDRGPVDHGRILPLLVAALGL